MIILENVNLDEIKFSDDGRNVMFKFIDMDKGVFFKEVDCISVVSFNYQNIFDEDDGFACYITEVNSNQFDSKKVKNYLKNMCFDYENYMEANKVTKLNLLNIISGEIEISVICRSLEIINETNRVQAPR